ncbi:MAG: HPF/RaiA family ribosome-associated protein [Bryobacteraceae bacterium]|nr:HPF/RaiA family ribosome-associated protein [Bryobacterales bacterium]MEB2362035.1 HPF/RaiA family ribosome-associated protein [Bryobacterales bacterium]NUN02885.1 HPF/RaiA family ribosome-associated protein [Bryobacteraceae bacterium]
MKVTFTGRNDELPAVQRAKLDVKLRKIAKLFDGKKGEREAHVILSSERHLHHAEITVKFYDHQVIGVHSDPDLFTAISGAIDRAEKQILRLRTKWRDTKRGPKDIWADENESEVAPVSTRSVAAELETEDGAAGRTVFRVNHHETRKPMTLEEALLQMDRNLDYIVYRDSETDRVSVLVRRRDGNFDLIES